MLLHEWITIFTTILVAVLASTPGVLAYRNQQKKVAFENKNTQASASATLVETAMKQNAQLRKDIDELQEEMEKFKHCREVVELLVKELRAMYYQLHSNGITPVTDMTKVEASLKEFSQ